MKETTAGLPISHAQLTSPPLHIPDGNGGSYKTELVLFRSAERTEKINWWHGPDPRREPHNHPWPFTSTIIAGALTMTRWRFDLDELEWVQTIVTYRAGDTYDMPADEFHTVDAVEHGTVTHMVCGALYQAVLAPTTDESLAEFRESWNERAARRRGEWGYLVGGRYEPAKPDLDFKAKLAAINPHMRAR